MIWVGNYQHTCLKLQQYAHLSTSHFVWAEGVMIVDLILYATVLTHSVLVKYGCMAYVFYNYGGYHCIMPNNPNQQAPRLIVFIFC